VYTFHWYHWFALKLFPVGCAQDTENSSVFCYDSALIFLYTAESATTHSVCHRDRADPLFIAGVMVHYSAFRMPKYLEPVFWRYLAIVGRISKIISPLDSANFSTSDGMDKTNFRNQSFFEFGVPHLRLLIFVGLRRQKAHALSIGTIDLHIFKVIGTDTDGSATY